MYRESNLGLLIKLSPRAAADKISQAFLEFNLHDQAADGRAVELVAARLDVSPSTLKRHLRALAQAGVEVRRVSKAKTEAAPVAKSKPKKAPARRAKLPAKKQPRGKKNAA